MKCGPFRALKEELAHDWDKLNLAAKILVIIGAVVFMASLFVAFNNLPSEDISRSIDVVFRSSLASIFGFILSSNLKNNGKKEDIDLLRDSCEDYREKHNYSDGNSVQLMIAFLVCITSIIAILIIYVYNLYQNIAAISQLRDLMCSSIGFLLGESKIKK